MLYPTLKPLRPDQKKIWIFSVGRRGSAVLDLPSIFTYKIGITFRALQFYYVIISVDLILGYFKLSGWGNSISVTAKFATSQTQSRWTSPVQSLVIYPSSNFYVTWCQQICIDLVIDPSVKCLNAESEFPSMLRLMSKALKVSDIEVYMKAHC